MLPLQFPTSTRNHLGLSWLGCGGVFWFCWWAEEVQNGLNVYGEGGEAAATGGDKPEEQHSTELRLFPDHLPVGWYISSINIFLYFSRLLENRAPYQNFVCPFCRYGKYAWSMKVKQKKTLRESQNAALWTSLRLSMCQVVFTKLCHYYYCHYCYSHYCHFNYYH